MNTTSGKRDSNVRGFTLIEVLVALVVLTLVAGVLLTAHPRMQQAGDRARWLGGARFQAEQVMTRARLGLQIDAATQSNNAPWQVTLANVAGGNSAAQANWRVWQIAPTSQPFLVTRVYLRR